MNKPLFIHDVLQPPDIHSAEPIQQDLLRHRLPQRRPRHVQDALPTVQDAEIVPQVEVPGLQHRGQLMGGPAHDVLEFLMREAGLRVGVEGGKERAGEVWVPADALDAVVGTGVHGDGGVDGGLDERGVVELGDPPDRHGRGAELLEQAGALFLECGERGPRGDERVFALAFQSIKPLDPGWAAVMRVIHVWEENLVGVVIR